jgi:hypothetical protein
VLLFDYQRINGMLIVKLYVLGPCLNLSNPLKFRIDQ